MEAVIQSFLAGAPILLLHFGLTLLLLAIGAILYMLMTPYHEIRLIRDGNIAAAISLGAVLLGLAIPLAFSMAESVNTTDLLIFGAVAILLQLIAFRVTDLIIRDLAKRITAGEIGPAILLAAIKLSIAAINAAAVGG